MTPPRILIAGIGNIFLGDDAFGSEVARRLAAQPIPDGVRVVDFGIRGFDLAYALIDGYDATILVDATPRGGSPGTLYLIEPDPGEARDAGGRRPVDPDAWHGSREGPSPGGGHGRSDRARAPRRLRARDDRHRRGPGHGAQRPRRGGRGRIHPTHRYTRRQAPRGASRPWQGPGSRSRARDVGNKRQEKEGMRRCWNESPDSFIGILTILVLGLAGVIMFIPDAGRYFVKACRHRAWYPA